MQIRSLFSLEYKENKRYFKHAYHYKTLVISIFPYAGRALTVAAALTCKFVLEELIFFRFESTLLDNGKCYGIGRVGECLEVVDHFSNPVNWPQYCASRIKGGYCVTRYYPDYGIAELFGNIFV